MKTNKFYKAAEKGYSFAALGYEFNLAFLWFDLWVGFYYDRAQKTLYFCPFPTIVLRARRARVSKVKIEFKFINVIPLGFVGELQARLENIKKDELKKIADRTKEQINNIQNNYADRMNYKVFSASEKGKPPVVAFSPDWTKGNISSAAADRSTRLAVENQPLDPEDDPTCLTAKKFAAMVERARFRPPIETIKTGELKPSMCRRGFRQPAKRKKGKNRRDKRK